MTAMLASGRRLASPLQIVARTGLIVRRTLASEASDVRVVSFTDPRYVFEHRARNDAILSRKPGA